MSSKLQSFSHSIINYSNLHIPQYPKIIAYKVLMSSYILLGNEQTSVRMKILQNNTDCKICQFNSHGRSENKMLNTTLVKFSGSTFK